MSKSDNPSDPSDPNQDSTSMRALMDSLPQTEYGKQETWSNGKYKFEMFPEGYIALNKELATGLHPKLEKLLANHPADDVDVKLSEIALYCAVVLDATYTLAERDKLCFILAGRLEAMREMPSNIVVQ